VGTPYERKLKQQNEYLENSLLVLNNRINNTTEIIKKLQEKDTYVYNSIFEIKDDTTKEILPLMRIEFNDSSVHFLESRLNRIDVAIKDVDENLNIIVYSMLHKKDMLSHIPAISPIMITRNTQMTSGFGTRIDPILKILMMHEGLDFISRIGTPIYATADGIVSEVNYSTENYGIDIIINHGYGYQTLYGHLSRVLVKVGQKIKRGDKIALLGNTGRSTGPHVHYEVIKNGIKINPIHFMFLNVTPDQYAELVRRSKLKAQPLD
jgi:murein DD-endopeptidase MepM/ murein hydrolase activator NlpD